MTDESARRTTASAEHTGRACPYCRFPLKEGAAIAECGTCGATHHEECWDDNGGCAVMGCAAGPGPRPAAFPPPPASTATIPAAPATPAYPGFPPPPPGLPPQPAARSYGWLIAAVLVLTLVVAGGALAVVLSSGEDPPVVDTVATETTTETTTTDESYPGTTATTSMSGALPDLSDSEMEEEIESMLYDFHIALRNGDSSAAWDLLTPRKQTKYERPSEGGYSQWQANQATVGRFINPGELNDVSIYDKDPSTGVVTIELEMGWDGSSCSNWTGITWVRYENGSWLYDPGYSTTPQRRRDWEPRKVETFGWGCLS